MSWEISVFAAREVPPAVEDLPTDWRGDALGSGEEVRRRISECLPDVDWSDPEWGVLRVGDLSFEFNLGPEEPKLSFMIHVLGSGDALPILERLARHSGWFLLDCARGEWLHQVSDPEQGWQAFQGYRDRSLKRRASGQRLD